MGGVFSQLRQFCAASGAQRASCLCHKTSSWSGHVYMCTGSPRDLWLEAEIGTAGREFPTCCAVTEGSTPWYTVL